MGFASALEASRSNNSVISSGALFADTTITHKSADETLVAITQKGKNAKKDFVHLLSFIACLLLPACVGR